MTQTQGDSRVWLKSSLFRPTPWVLKPNRKKKNHQRSMPKGPVSRTEVNPVSWHFITQIKTWWDSWSIKRYGLQFMCNSLKASPIHCHYRVWAGGTQCYIWECVWWRTRTAPAQWTRNPSVLHTWWDGIDLLWLDRKWTNPIVWITDLNGVFNEISNGTPVSLRLQQLRFTRCHMLTKSGGANQLVSYGETLFMSQLYSKLSVCKYRCETANNICFLGAIDLIIYHWAYKTILGNPGIPTGLLCWSWVCVHMYPVQYHVLLFKLQDSWVQYRNAKILWTHKG